MEDIQRTLENLTQSISQLKREKNDITLPQFCSSYTPASTTFQATRQLQGHSAKISAVHCSKTRDLILSAAQDGFLILWDPLTGLKLKAMPLASPWVMTCGLSDSAQLVASGGLDNACTVMSWKGGNAGPVQRLVAHEGYLSACRFLENDTKILTSSGDGSCAFWDIERGIRELAFLGHQSDVSAVCVEKEGVFLSGSADQTARLWDLKSGKNVKIFQAKEEVNALCAFPDANLFAVGAEAGVCCLYDLRSESVLAEYTLPTQRPITALSFSHSGKYLFCASDKSIFVFDTMKGTQVTQLNAHQNRVSSLCLLASGQALCSGSWDGLLKIWA